MNTQVRQKLEMAARVRSFSRTHPSPLPEYVKVLGELEERLTRAGTVAEREVNGTVAARAARVKRRELRRAVHSRLLRYLVAVGGVAAKSRGELAEKLKLPNGSASTQAFLTAVRGLVTRAEEQKALLLEKGMGETLLDDIRAQLGEMESAWEAAGRADRPHRRQGGSRADHSRDHGPGEGAGRVQPDPVRERFRGARRVVRREARDRIAAGRGGARPWDGGGSAG